MSNRPKRTIKATGRALVNDNPGEVNDEALLAMCDGNFDAFFELKASLLGEAAGAAGGLETKIDGVGGRGRGGKGGGRGRKRELEEVARVDEEEDRERATRKRSRPAAEDKARAQSEVNAGPSNRPTRGGRGASGGRGLGDAPTDLVAPESRAQARGGRGRSSKPLPTDARGLQKHYRVNSVQEQAFLSAMEDESVKHLMRNIHRNYEPYRQGPWRREPWPAREYAQLDVNCIAEDCPFDDDICTIQAKLLTDKRAEEGEERKDMDVRSPHFGWTLPQVPPPLLEKEDFHEQPCWGLDCFTRVNLVEALLRCEGLVPAGTPEGEARRVCEDFIEFEILPSMNKAADMGWDLVRACDLLQSEARAAGREVEARVAQRLKEVIEGVEAAHGFQRGSEAYMAAFTAEIDPSAIEALEALKAADRRDFRAHPKGMGIVCRRKGGIKAGTFVAEWAGEVYPPWRWFEKQDAFKRKNPHAPLPDFYNIMLERPRDDSMGYDVLFVDASVRGNFTSRMSHSCTPNCHTMPMCAGGRVCIAFVAIRDIREGEELTWDYNSVTESEKEFREATCLCGTRGCRGSFLHYANNRSFQEVLGRDLLFLQRTAMILRGAQEAFGPEDEEALGRLGIKTAALAKEVTLEARARDLLPKERLPPGILRSAYVEVEEGDLVDPSRPVVMPKVTPLPDWVRKWAALVARFIERERRELPGVLVEESRKFMQMLNNPEARQEQEEKDRMDLTLENFEDPTGKHGDPFASKKAETTYTHEYSLEEAEEVAAGVRENRIQNLIITIDKVRYFLRQAEKTYAQPLEQSPLRPLTDAEVVEHLWTGSESIVRKFAVRSIPMTCPGLAARGREKNPEPDFVSDPDLIACFEDGEGWQHAKALRTLLDKARPKTADEARARLLEFADILKTTGMGHHAAAYDTLMMYGHTRHFFTVWDFDHGIKSHPVTSWWDTGAPAPGFQLAEAVDPKAKTRRAVQDAIAKAEGAGPGPSLSQGERTPVKRKAGGAGSSVATPLGASQQHLAPKSPSQTPVGRQQKLALQAAMADPDLRKKYSPHYVWGQMSTWMKQTIYDPSASLSAERRGTLSLPDPETCYSSSFVTYAKQPAKGESDRAKLLDMMERNPNAQWPTTFFFRFQNPSKVYGSPQFDWALQQTKGEDSSTLRDLIRTLKETTWEHRGRAQAVTRKRARDGSEDPVFAPSKTEAALNRRSGRERTHPPPFGVESLSHLASRPTSPVKAPRRGGRAASRSPAPAMAPASTPKKGNSKGPSAPTSLDVKRETPLKAPKSKGKNVVEAQAPAPGPGRSPLAPTNKANAANKQVAVADAAIPTSPEKRKTRKSARRL